MTEAREGSQGTVSGRVTPQEVETLLAWFDAMRSADRDSLVIVAANVAGHARPSGPRDRDEGGLRALGAVRDDLLSLVSRSRLTADERELVVRRRGLIRYPEPVSGKSMPRLEGTVAGSRGAPIGRKRLHDIYRSAVAKLAAEVQTNPADPVSVRPVANPATARWLERYLRRWTPGDRESHRRRLLAAAATAAQGDLIDNRSQRRLWSALEHYRYRVLDDPPQILEAVGGLEHTHPDDRQRAFAQIAIHLWRLVALEDKRSKYRPDDVAYGASLYTSHYSLERPGPRPLLHAVPAPFAGVASGSTTSSALADAAAAVRSQDRSDPHALTQAQLLVAALDRTPHAVADAVAASVLGIATNVSSYAHQLWAVELGGRMLVSHPAYVGSPRAAIDAALSAAENGRLDVAEHLLNVATAQFDELGAPSSDVPPNIERVETHQQFALARSAVYRTAATFALCTDAPDWAAFERLWRRAYRETTISEAKLWELDKIDDRWNGFGDPVGRHGGDATAHWPFRPLLRKAELLALLYAASEGGFQPAGRQLDVGGQLDRALTELARVPKNPAFPDFASLSAGRVTMTVALLRDDARCYAETRGALDLMQQPFATAAYNSREELERLAWLDDLAERRWGYVAPSASRGQMRDLVPTIRSGTAALLRGLIGPGC